MEIDLSPSEYKKVVLLINTYLPDTDVWAFGSRVKFTSKPESDLDLVVFTNADQSERLRLLNEEFLNSDLPFKVDLLAWNEIPESFKKNIKKQYIIINNKFVDSAGWVVEPISNIVNIIGGGTPKTTVSEYWGGDIPWLSVTDFGNDLKYVYTTEKTITPKGLAESSTKLLKKGQIIISARGTVGELAVLGKDMTFNQSCYGITAKGDNHNDFIYYLLKDSVSKIKKNTHGAVFDTITRQTFDNILVKVPKQIEDQKSIASILSSLDDKIELNIQMNQTLEEMAQAIFRKWCCVDNEDLPNGWKTVKLADIADVTSSKRVFRDEYVSNGVPFYRGKEITQLSKGNSISTELYISEERYDEIKRKFGVPKIGDLLVTSVGTIGSVWLVDNDLPFYFKDGNVTWIKDFKSKINGDYIYQWLQTKKATEQIRSSTIGSTQEALTIAALKSLKIFVPDDETVARLILQLEKINLKRINNIRQIRTLTAIRDNLLPKLMTGKLKPKENHNA